MCKTFDLDTVDQARVGWSRDSLVDQTRLTHPLAGEGVLRDQVNR